MRRQTKRRSFDIFFIIKWPSAVCPLDHHQQQRKQQQRDCHQLIAVNVVLRVIAKRLISWR